METRKKISFLLLIALLVSGLSLTGCPGETTKEVIIPEPTPRELQATVLPSAIRMTSEDWGKASPDKKTFTVKLSESKPASYQWYSQDSRNIPGTPIDGATAASYMPSITAATNKTYYYYVEVTTDEKVLKGYAQVTIGSPDNAPTQFTIGSDRVHYVRGVGGTGSFMFRDGDNADASPDADVQYIDLLMGEMGCNILRIMVQDDYKNYIDNKVQSRNKSVFTHNASKNFFSVIQRVNELGGYVFANPWTAPKEYKTPQQITGSGSKLTETPQNYVAYADYLRDFLKWLNANNAPIFALGICNEPDYGNTVGYEGMGMTSAVHRDWFKTVGHFTTQKAQATEATTVGGATLTDDIIPGYGGGGKTHHVLAMTGDIMSSPSYFNPTINEKDANKNFEILGRHYYERGNPLTRVSSLAGPVGTIWKDRPQEFGTGSPKVRYAGRFEAESLRDSPQMFAPGSKAGNIKREIWQTEHDFNYWENSTNIPGSNVQRYWNSAFAAMNDVDWALRVFQESVFDWWFSSSYSGLVTSYMGTPVNGDGKASIAGAKEWPPYTYTPRGRAFAHYARYVNETWSLPINQTRTKQGDNMTFNSTKSSFDAGSIDPKIGAFEDVNGKFISIVMFTPNASTATNNIATATKSGEIGNAYGKGGENGTNDPTRLSANVGRVEVVLPPGFTATSASALRSYGWENAEGESWDDVPYGTPRYWINEPVLLYKTSDGKAAVEVTLPGGNIISIMVKGTWPGRPDIASPPRVRPYIVN